MSIIIDYTILVGKKMRFSNEKFQDKFIIKYKLEILRDITIKNCGACTELEYAANLIFKIFKENNSSLEFFLFSH
jgi:hypothetical protein